MGVKEIKVCFLLHYGIRIYSIGGSMQIREMAENCDIGYKVVATTVAILVL